MFYTDNPVADYDRYCNEQQKVLDRLPRCSECHEPIQDECAYYINDEWICKKCMEDNYLIVVPEE